MLESNGPKGRPREMTIHVEAFDWKSPRHIPLRLEAEDLQRALGERDQRIAQREARLAASNHDLRRL